MILENNQELAIVKIRFAFLLDNVGVLD